MSNFFIHRIKFIISVVGQMFKIILKSIHNILDISSVQDVLNFGIELNGVKKRMKRNYLVILAALVCTMIFVSPALADADLTGDRTISDSTVQAGDTFRVTMTMTCVGDADISAPAIDEDVPSGWTVTEVDSGYMIYKSSTIEWIYLGSLSPSETMTVVYDVTVPSSATAGTYSISGEVSGIEDVGGNIVYRTSTIAGDSVITVA